MMKLGYNTAGTEEVFEEMLDGAIVAHLRGERLSPVQTTFNYLEVGIAEGTTLGSVANWLRRNPLAKWNAFGVDLLNGPYFNPLKWMLDNKELATSVCHLPGILVYDLSKTHGSAHVQLTDHGLHGIRFKDTQFNFALIDGCHGAPCVQGDFMYIEPLMARGGIVAFHDALPEDQDRDFQPHCQMPISVRKALGNLGLLQGSRPGWEFVTEVAGDKTREGNGFMFFRRI